jgi:uncharacterized membrane protein (UPF0127 family)
MRFVAGGLLLLGAAGIVAGAVLVARDEGAEEPSGQGASSSTPLVLHTRAASSPFVGLTEAELGVDDRCLHVVVADDQAERVQGLRGRHDVGPYDGMLFRFTEPTEAAFTMSTVPVPLDIGFYRANGSLVSHRHMTPCPRADAECPAYTASAPYLYALETLGGRLPAGAISACS